MARAKKSNLSSNKAADAAKTDETEKVASVEKGGIAEKIKADAAELKKADAASEDIVENAAPTVEEPLDQGAAQDVEKPAQASVENQQTTQAEIVHPMPVPVEPEKRGGFFPLVLGGLVAGGIGFMASELDMFGAPPPAIEFDATELNAKIDAQADRIAVLERVEPAAPDTSAVEALQSDLATINGTLTKFDGRIAELQSRPIVVDSGTGVADAYAEELARLRASFEAQRDEIEEQRLEIQGLLTNALSVEEATALAAKASAGHAALARIVSALESGQSLDGPIADLQTLGDLEVPAALAEVAGAGVATLADLQARFPNTSRAALAAARKNAPEAGDGGLGGFLKRQLGARSVAPREGADADAILSRAENAVRNGRLTDALAEIDTLPEAAQSAMQSWIADARARDAALAAANALAQRLTAN